MPNIANINTLTRDLCDADATSYPDAILLLHTNAGYEETVGDIIGFDGLWQFDDSNFTDLPIGTTTLVADQQDYSFDVTQLEIERVEVKDASGLWQLLTPIDKSQIPYALSEYQKTSSLPREYDKQGSSIFLYPAPSAATTTLSSGLKVYFKRTASIFTSGEVSTGTKVPGFPSPYHYILSYKAAIPYCAKYKKDRVPAYLEKIAELKAGLEKLVSKREQDRRKGLSMAPISFR
jgi:hypothetical protein